MRETEKQRKGEESIKTKKLKRHFHNCNVWSLFGFWFKLLKIYVTFEIIRILNICELSAGIKELLSCFKYNNDSVMIWCIYNQVIWQVWFTLK